MNSIVPARSTAVARPTGVSDAFNRCVSWVCCLVTGGHTDMQQYGEARLYLVCTNCGRETPGWITARRPARGK